MWSLFPMMWTRRHRAYEIDTFNEPHARPRNALRDEGGQALKHQNIQLN